jgi:hypothetical protein
VRLLAFSAVVRKPSAVTPRASVTDQELRVVTLGKPARREPKGPACPVTNSMRGPIMPSEALAMSVYVPLIDTATASEAEKPTSQTDSQSLKAPSP